MAGGDALERLRQAMSARLPPTPFVGAGLSLALTNGAAHASWTGLLRDGVRECERVAPGLPPGWVGRMNDELDDADVISCVAIGDQITRRLRAVGRGTGFSSWIEGTVGRLHPAPEHLETIRACAGWRKTS